MVATLQAAMPREAAISAPHKAPPHLPDTETVIEIVFSLPTDKPITMSALQYRDLQRGLARLTPKLFRMMFDEECEGSIKVYVANHRVVGVASHTEEHYRD